MQVECRAYSPGVRARVHVASTSPATDGATRDLPPCDLALCRYSVRRALPRSRADPARPEVSLTVIPCVTETRRCSAGGAGIGRCGGWRGRRHGSREAIVLGSLMTRVARSGRFWLVLLPAGLLAMVSAGPSAAADGTCLFDRVTGNTTCTFASTGAEQTFTVPADVSSLSVVAKGAAGASASDGAAPGGEGAVVQRDVVGHARRAALRRGRRSADRRRLRYQCELRRWVQRGWVEPRRRWRRWRLGYPHDHQQHSGTLTSRLLVAAGGGGGGGGQVCTDSTGGAGGKAGEPG